MAWQKMGLLAVAGVLCMSALLNGAEASVSASNPPLRNATQASGCGNFVASCNGISISGSNLAATCKDGHGSSHFTELDLNPHLSNVNGILEPGGAYIETCTPQGGRQEGSSFFIFAQCSREDGKVVPTFFDVNNNVANIFGTLEWFDCNQLLAMDEIAAADEDVALSGRKLLNH
ncbi:hypothetical protein BDL97_11G000200 [Sphagnum fallax]|nr:hypothetical protein BDL97_11G000200 [Sphagnum fallax]